MNCVHNLFVLSCLLVGLTFVKGLHLYSENDRIKDNCMTQHDLTPEQVKNIFAEGELPSGENEECFLACVLKKHKVMTEDNLLNVEYIKKKLAVVKLQNKEVYEKIIAVCDETLEETKNMPDVADECKAAANIAKVLNPKIQELKENLEHP